MSDPQDNAEALDADKVDTDYPPDQPLGVDEPEVTTDGEWERETFEERSERVEADPGPDREVIRPFVDPSQDILDDEKQLVAEADPGQGDSFELVGDGVPAPAEEAAMHIEEP